MYHILRTPVLGVGVQVHQPAIASVEAQEDVLEGL